MNTHDSAKSDLPTEPETTTELSPDELEDANGGIAPLVAFVGRAVLWEGASWAVGKLTKK